MGDVLWEMCKWRIAVFKSCFVLLCLIGEQHRLSYFRELIYDGYCLAILHYIALIRFRSPRFTFIFHYTNKTRNEGTTDDSGKRSDTVSGTIPICTVVS